MPGLFVAMLSFPRTVLSLKQSTEPTQVHIRRRLTLGYVGIFALILLFIGVVVVASFARQAAGQQDELLEQKAQGDADYVSGPLLHFYQEGREPERGPLPLESGAV